MIIIVIDSRLYRIMTHNNNDNKKHLCTRKLGCYFIDDGIYFVWQRFFVVFVNLVYKVYRILTCYDNDKFAVYVLHI